MLGLAHCRVGSPQGVLWGRVVLPRYPLGHFLKGLLPGDASALGSTPLPGVWLQEVMGGGQGRMNEESKRLEVPGTVWLGLGPDGSKKGRSQLGWAPGSGRQGTGSS